MQIAALSNFVRQIHAFDANYFKNHKTVHWQSLQNTNFATLLFFPKRQIRLSSLGPSGPKSDMEFSYDGDRALSFFLFFSSYSTCLYQFEPTWACCQNGLKMREVLFRSSFEIQRLEATRSLELKSFLDAKRWYFEREKNHICKQHLLLLRDIKMTRCRMSSAICEQNLILD